MSYKKFEPNDLITNTMRTHPHCEFFIYNGSVYYNNVPEQAGEFSSNIINKPGGPPGHISLYERNIDKLSGSNNFIVPYIHKSGDRVKFRKTTDQEWISRPYGYKFDNAHPFPLSSSITREFMTGGAGSVQTSVDPFRTHLSTTKPNYPHFYSLKNRLDFYGTLTEHYIVSSSFANKNTQDVNLISIPSIFFGDRIKPGTMCLKWYYTGSLIAEARDEKRNGELIQTGPEGSTGSGSVAGVVLYNEGFILLTGSWGFHTNTIGLASTVEADGVESTPAWLYFGACALDGVNSTSAGVTYQSASFSINFNGTNNVETITMFAHAKKGEVNYSNNPTFIQYGQEQISQTSSNSYIENSSRLIHNTVSSSFLGYDGDFERQVYISRIAIYDENKNLLGIATLSNPILKKEDEDLSFKIKLDI